MGWITTGIRRSILLVVVVAAGGAFWSWRRDVADASSPGPAEWPPLTTAPPAPAAVPAPATPPARAAGDWRAPLDDGSCPIGYPVKAKDSSRIFHIPNGRFYDRTNAERCYSDADAAIADGYRQAKR